MPNLCLHFFLFFSHWDLLFVDFFIGSGFLVLHILGNEIL
jgi:hypothetical protein